MSSGWSSLPVTIIVDIRFAKNNSVLESGLCLSELVSSCCENIKRNLEFNYKFLLVSSEISPSWVIALISQYPSLVRFWQFKTRHNSGVFNPGNWSTKAFYKVSSIIGHKFIWINFEVYNTPRPRFFSSRKYRKERLVYIFSGGLKSSFAVRKKIFPLIRYKNQLKQIINSMRWVSGFSDSGYRSLDKLSGKKKYPINKLPFAIQSFDDMKDSSDIIDFRKNFIDQFYSLEDSDFKKSILNSFWVLCYHDSLLDLHFSWLKEYNEILLKEIQTSSVSNVFYINVSNYFDNNKQMINEKSKVLSINLTNADDFNFPLVLQASDIFLNKKSDAPYELVMLEGILAGCPMLYNENCISDFTFSFDIIPNGYVNCLNSESPKDWANTSIKKITENKNLLSVNRVVSNNHKDHVSKIKKYYSWNTVSIHWNEYFKKIIENLS